MTERSSKICLISPTENLARRAKPLIMRRGMDVRVEVAELEAAVALAKRLLTQNDYLFISRRGTRPVAQESEHSGREHPRRSIGLYPGHPAASARAGAYCFLFL